MKETKELLKKFGLNEIPEPKVNFFQKFILPLLSPISLMFFFAALFSYLNHKIFDFYFILVLFGINYFIQKWQEFKADESIEYLKNKLVSEIFVLRDKKWQQIDSKFIVPGDIVRLKPGDIVPADGKIIFAKNLTLNEALITGESLPREKKEGDKILMGSTIYSGITIFKVEATGKSTVFGKTIFSIEKTTKRSELEIEILLISKFLMTLSLIAILIFTFIFILKDYPLYELLTIDLSLALSGIPIALPTVMTVILAIGIKELTKKNIIVRRLSALEDLANVNLLLTDKTGTLTKNEISIVEIFSLFPGLTERDIIRLASYTAGAELSNPIDLAIIKKLEEIKEKQNGGVVDFIPFDSERKRATVLVKENSKNILISLGAIQVIKEIGNFISQEARKNFEQAINEASKNGYRALALAIKKTDHIIEENMLIAGILFLADPLDDDVKETINFLKENGIEIKMITGDNKIIAKKVADDLELAGKIVDTKGEKKLLESKALKDQIKEIAGFAEVLPEDKYKITKLLTSYYIIAVTGDGINDLPAFKAAHIGIAVSRAVGALKSAADIVLLEKGLKPIKDAILESRKIFVRLYNYSIYRLAESFRVILGILILWLWHGYYPLTSFQLIVLALLNDIPIVSLGFDRVKELIQPSKIKPKERFILSSLFGLVGVFNSILFFVLLLKVFHLPFNYVQTMFFLKLTVSGHALIFVAHTKEKWWQFLPSKEVIFATIGTQIIATILAVSGFLMPAKISFLSAFFVWGWAFFWMQISELIKIIKF